MEDEPNLGSKGLAAEAKESIACSIDSALTLLAMAAGLLRAPGWVDPALSLLMVPWFLREGLAHVRGPRARARALITASRRFV